MSPKIGTPMRAAIPAPCSQAPPRRAQGFTLIELLVVIAITAILASLLLPVLTRGRMKAQGAQCMSNNRQLAFAWRMYTEDSHDRLLWASADVSTFTWNEYVWCNGRMNFDNNNRSNWDPTEDIMPRAGDPVHTGSKLWPYCGKSLGIWKCPADKSYVTPPGQTQVRRVRSMAMNAYLGGFKGVALSSYKMSTCRLYLKSSELSIPGADKIFLFIDERPDAINWGNFLQDMNGYSPRNPSLWRFLDWPGFSHGNACGLSFCDGHAEIHRWVDGRTMPPPFDTLAFFNGSTTTASADNRDVDWLQDRASRPR